MVAKGRGGDIYTRAIVKPYKSGLFFSQQAGLLNIYQHTTRHDGGQNWNEPWPLQGTVWWGGARRSCAEAGEAFHGRPLGGGGPPQGCVCWKGQGCWAGVWRRAVLDWPSALSLSFPWGIYHFIKFFWGQPGQQVCLSHLSSKGDFRDLGVEM